MAARSTHFCRWDELEAALAFGLGTCPCVIQRDALVQTGTGLWTDRLFPPVWVRVLRSLWDRAVPSHRGLVEWGPIHRSQGVEWLLRTTARRAISYTRLVERDTMEE